MSDTTLRILFDNTGTPPTVVPPGSTPTAPAPSVPGEDEESPRYRRSARPEGSSYSHFETGGDLEGKVKDAIEKMREEDTGRREWDNIFFSQYSALEESQKQIHWEDQRRSRSKELLQARRGPEGKSHEMEAKENYEMSSMFRDDEHELFKARMKVEEESLARAKIAQQQFDEEILLRKRSLDILKERHEIEGAASKEVSLQLQLEKEQREWSQKMKQERYKQNPAEATKDAFGTLSDLFGKGGSGMLSGIFGTVSKVAGMESEGKGFGNLFKMMTGGSKGSAASTVDSAASASGAAEAAGAAEGAAGGAAGAAGGMAGMAGGLAAAAGPIGLIIEVAQQVEKAFWKAIDGVMLFEKRVAEVGNDIYNNDFNAAFTKTIDSVAGFAENFGFYGKLIGKGMEFVSENFKIFGALQESIINYGKQHLAPYSGAIQTSTVNAEIRSMMADIREAQSLGSGIARLIDLQSIANNELRELVEPIKEIMAQVLSFPMEIVIEVARTLKDMEREFGVLATISAYIKAILDIAREILKTKVDDVNDQDFGENFLKFFSNDKANQAAARNTPLAGNGNQNRQQRNIKEDIKEGARRGFNGWNDVMAGFNGRLDVVLGRRLLGF